MKIASWNVNSIRARLGHVTSWLQSTAPDVLMMQELKGEVFPHDEFRALGYESAAVTQKTYNGVAIVARLPVKVISTTLPGDDKDSHARYLEVDIDGMRLVNIYAPNGNPPGGDKFLYKLAWMDRLAEKMRAWATGAEPTLIGGDWNVIPEDIDCHKPSSWMHDALFQPETRERYRAMLALGYVDVFRTLHPTEKQFTYWDYFRMAFEHNRGIRIDHFLCTASLFKRVTACAIDREPRTREKPSDHAPILIEVD